MICLVNTSPMIPEIQKQVTSKTFLPIPMPLPSLSPIVAASASAGFGTSFILTIVAAPIPVTTIAKIIPEVSVPMYLVQYLNTGQKY